MAATAGAKKPPVHRLAWLAFALALTAFALSLYGSLHAEKHIAGSPLRDARGNSGFSVEPTKWYERLLARGEVSVFGERIDRKILAITERSKIANYSLQIVAYVLPFLLGLAAALTGGQAMSVIERTNGQYGGYLQTVLAMMIGGFAACIGGCMMLSVFVWPMLPSLYTV